VLLVLLENSGEVVTYDEILDRVWWDTSIQAFDNSLRVAINKLRQALRDDPDDPIYIETLSRRGYRWLYPVSVEDTEQDSGEGENEPEASLERNNGAATDYSQPAKPIGAALLRRSILSLFVSLAALAAIWQLQPHPATPEPKVVPLTTYPAWNTCRQFRRTANGWRSRGRVRVQRTLQNLREAHQRGPNPASG
jgi:DNA-binding winged helix-turn-helix (wHTH) protein